MPGAARTIHIEAESELGQILETAADTDVLLEKEGVRFRLNRIDTVESSRRDGDRALAPERVLRIIGLGASTQDSDIARLKDQYVAEAAADLER